MRSGCFKASISTILLLLSYSIVADSEKLIPCNGSCAYTIEWTDAANRKAIETSIPGTYIKLHQIFENSKSVELFVDLKDPETDEYNREYRIFNEGFKTTFKNIKTANKVFQLEISEIGHNYVNIKIDEIKTEDEGSIKNNVDTSLDNESSQDEVNTAINSSGDTKDSSSKNTIKMWLIILMIIVSFIAITYSYKRHLNHLKYIVTTVIALNCLIVGIIGLF